MPFCPQCGTELAATDTFCEDCGCRLGDRTSQPSSHAGGHSPGDAPAEQHHTPPAGPAGARPRQEVSGNHPGQAPPQNHPGQAPPQNHPGQAPPGENRRRQPQHQSTRGADPQYVHEGKVSYATFFPVTGGYKALGFGALCTLLSPLVVPFILLCGYTARLTGAAARGDSSRPPFDDVRELLQDGLFYTVLSALVVGVGALLANGVTTAGETLGQSGTLAVAVGLVGLAVSYVLPAVLVLYPVTGQFTEALSPSRIHSFVYSKYYLVSYLIFLGLVACVLALGVVFSIMTTILLFILPFVGFPLALLVPPYLLFAAGAYWGGTYRIAVEDGLVPEPVEAETDDAQTEASLADDRYSRT